MVFIEGHYFWGSLLIVLGTALLLKEIFKWDIPIFKILIGIFLIYWGCALLFKVNGSLVNYSFNKNFDHKNFEVKVDFKYPKNDTEE